MLSSRDKRRYFFIGLFLIVLVYALYNIFLVDIDYYNDIPRHLRHVAKFGTILLIYLTGAWSLRRFSGSWMIFIWHAVYLLVIVILVWIGVFDWTVSVISERLRNIASSLHELLISPLLYVVLGIIDNRMSRD
jgi:hypothetical protein